MPKSVSETIRWNKHLCIYEYTLISPLKTPPTNRHPSLNNVTRWKNEILKMVRASLIIISPSLNTSPPPMKKYDNAPGILMEKLGYLWAKIFYVVNGNNILIQNKLKTTYWLILLNSSSHISSGQISKWSLHYQFWN